MQTRIGSILEVALNIGVGMAVALLSQMFIFPLYNITVTTTQHIEITIFFTVVSVVRSYIIRRYFNGLKLFTKQKGVQ